METVVETVQASLLFRTLAGRFPGVEVWPDEGYTEGGWEYSWIMARKQQQITKLAYTRRKGAALQLRTYDTGGETRWVDMEGLTPDQLMEMVPARLLPF